MGEADGRNDHDPKAQIRPVPALLAEGGPEDRQAPEPGHLRHPRGGRAARAGGAVLQAQALTGTDRPARNPRRARPAPPLRALPPAFSFRPSPVTPRSPSV